MDGILLINKPEGITSFDVVAIVRKFSKQKKVGHAGTLDPMATGVLPILLGKATKAQSIIPNTNKEYLASFKLGISTDTQDITGKVLSRQEPNVSVDQVKETLKNFQGEINQVPPMFSAVKKDGVRLYSLARKGIDVKRDPRTITIDKLKLTDFDAESGRGKILVSCSKGTYIRTLCHDIGQSLRTGAVMTALNRTYACGFSENECMSLEQFKEVSAEQKIKNVLLPIEKLFSCYPVLTVTDAQSIRFLNGGALSLGRLSINKNVQDSSKFCVYCKTGKFLGLGVVSTLKNELEVFKNFDTKEE